jgi:hypothetical protein
MKSNIINEKGSSLRTARIRGVLLVPLHNMVVDKSYIRPNLITGGTNAYEWGDVQEYFYHNLQMDQPPMHYFSEYVHTDYVFHVGAGLTSISPWLDALVKTGAIQHHFRDFIVVGMKEDFRKSVPDRRLFEGLAHFVITPILRLFKLSKEDVRFVDDILSEGAEALALEHPKQLRRFVLERSRYYDHSILDVVMNDYLKR